MKDPPLIKSIDTLRLSPSCIGRGNDLRLEKKQSPKCGFTKSHSEEKVVTEPSLNDNRRELLLYLIRHGEAEHNVKEKIAMQQALNRSINETGCGKECPETTQAIEEARRNALKDTSLRDAKLSQLGRTEAQDARERLLKIELETPSCVLVSPLTRTLETASIVFPEHHNCSIHVRDDLSERRTGLPPDLRLSVGSLSRRKSFQRFSMNQMQEESLSSMECSDSTLSVSTIDTIALMEQERSEAMDFRFIRRLQSARKEENREDLRKRTERLFGLLGETEHNSVAVVTHKGYLRELEKGPLGQTNVKEFDNCEIRVYRIVLATKDHRLIEAERVC